MTHPDESRRKLTGEVLISEETAKEVARSVQAVADLAGLVEREASSSISRLFEVLVAGAAALHASDIHLEPEEERIQARVRIDGILQDLALLSPSIYEDLVSRIKLTAGMKLNISDKPQDGRFSFAKAQGPSVEVRVSTLPSEYGESLVLRVLNPQAMVGLEDLGLRADLLELFSREIAKPTGMIAVTGPTGSGKTTTLYAFLREIKRPEIKIITIEDPIEYHLGGISQTQVDSAQGYTFASGLQAIVRQDPDVILVGEIRDRETAGIALQASLTGHLVLSTLHTNDAPGTVPRLQSLGEPPVNIAAGLNLIIAQRLVRTVCVSCSEQRPPSKKERERIQRALEQASELIQKLAPEEYTIAEPKGCRECNTQGYRGRTGIFEAIAVDQETEEFILTSPSVSALRSFAIKKGMVPLYQDGILKVMEGITTFDELDRVAAE